MVRGEHINGKRAFIDLEGIQFIIEELKKQLSYRQKIKMINILLDFVVSDDRLGDEIND